jgi:RHS repeat-associated protein
MTGRFVRAAAFVAGLALGVGLLTPAVATAAPGLPPLLGAKPTTPVAGRDATPVPPVVAAPAGRAPLATAWPVPASADLAASRTTTTVGGLPVRANSAVRVAVLDQVAVPGVLLRLTPTGRSATTRLSVGYAPFRDAHGADWAARLTLLRLPDCALTTPAAAHCRPTPLAATNDPAAATVTADVPTTSSTLVALVAGASGSTGDFRATPLAPSASWQVNEATGDFSWSYPLRVPPVPGGLTPDLALGYSSGGVDGRTASTNSQPSAVGEGWDLWPGYIERRYRTCSDDGRATSDQCWGPDNATLVLNGHATELLRDDATGTWRPRDDDGSRVDRLTGAANGDNDGEYWRVTTPDGTQYFFGRNRLPGWTTGKPLTSSAWTVPVFGNQAGEPCAAAPGWCQQAWRWNLDYVLDPHADAVAYYYKTESNNYRLGGAATGVAYTRGGYLWHADYGFRDGHAYDVNGPAALMNFGVTDRCDPASTGCASWPDTPTDQACTAATCAATQVAPTFWSRERLTSITSRVLRAGAYADVDRWALVQSFPLPGDGQSPALWLRSITHTGAVGGTVATPAVTFDPLPLQNRVNAATYPALNKQRVGSIHTEAGGVIGVTYLPQECTPSTLPAGQDGNTKRCFAQWWAPPAQAPILDWFHKYVVAQVTTTDPIGGSKQEETDYAYLDGAAWHYADADETTPVAKRTWSGWRGYGRVQVRHGSPAEGQSLVEDRFYRGMNGDHLAAGGTRTATVTDSQGGVVTDADGLAGQAREHVVFDGPGGAEVSGTISAPYRSVATAGHAHDGLTLAAYQVRPGDDRGRTDLLPGGVRLTATDRGYDASGRLTSVDDQGDTATAADDRCTRTTYAADAARWMLTYPAEVATVARRCAATPTYPADGLSDVRTYYGGSTTLGALPGAGDPTRTDAVKAYGASGPAAFVTTGASYDAYGRVLTSTDPIGRPTTTSYTGVPVTQTATTDAAGFITTTTLDPAWGQPVATVDANAHRTDLTYDALGRLAGVWLPDRPKATNSTGNLQFAYQVSATAASWVRTDKLAPSSLYLSSYALYDGLLRQRQTQVPADGGGRLVSDTFYNTRGLPYLAFNPYFTSGSPGTALFTTTPTLVPSETVTSYDGAERPTVVDSRRYDVELWQTATAYRGDHVDVTPPAGGTPTSTFADARGQTTELRQYHGATPTGTYDATTYGHTPAGLLATVTDPTGIAWSYGYDVLGRRTSATDPDRGPSAMTYDDAGQLLTTTDARGQTLAYTWDAIGRKTAEYAGSTAGTKLAGWTYDTLPGGTVVKGQPATSTRYDGANAYTEAVTGYDADYRPTGTSVTIPAAETGLAGTYTTPMTYALDGSIASQTLPAAGGLPAETVRYVYDSVGLPYSLKGTNSYVVDSVYTKYGEPSVYTLTTGTGTPVQLSYDFEDGTHRLAHTMLVRQSATDRTQADTHYGYDAAGNVTSIADTPAGHPADTQCFDYDHLRRLTEAWTPGGGDCSPGPGGVPGGAAPYWTSYGYDPTGSRTALTQHDPAGDTTVSYAYPAGAHTLRSATTTGPGGSRTDTYAYDALGDTTGRPGQTLGWDQEGRLTSAGATTYLYDADGNRLLQRDADGTTLYLPSGMEIRYTTATASTTCTRYYVHNGSTVAVRTTGGGLTWLATDPHGTANYAVAAATAAVTVRRTDPFGGIRGTAPAWPDTHGFLGKPVDATTGLTHLGARDYDPALGRFTSVDPLLDPADPQQLNGYAYANNNPTTNADPTGLLCANGPDGTCHTPHGNIPTPGISDRQDTGRAQLSGGSGAPVRRTYTPTQIRELYKIAAQCACDPTSHEFTMNLLKYGDYCHGNLSCVGELSFAATLDAESFERRTRLAMVIAALPAGCFFAGPTCLGGVFTLSEAELAATGAAKLATKAAARSSTEIAAESGVDATTTVGRRGSPLKVPRGTNQPAVINGRSYSGHALDEMQSEGFTVSVVDDAIANGQASVGGSGRIGYYSPANNITVVTESNGKIVTVTSGRLRIR